MSTDVLVVLAGVVAAAVYIVCTRTMAGMGGSGSRGGASGGGRSAGSGRGSTPANASGGKSAGRPSNWNADGTHGANYEKGSSPKAGTQGGKGAPGKAAPAGSGKVTTVRGHTHGTQSLNGTVANAAADQGTNTAPPGNDNDGGNMAGGNFGDLPVTGTTNVSYDANGNLITDEQPGGK